MKAAADNVTKVSLELGGKAPVIIMNDCKLDETVDHVMPSRLVNSGQACNCAERVYVQEDIADEFIAKITEKMKAVTFGPGLGGSFDIGPMVNKAQQEHVDELVQSAIEEGAKVLCGGKKATVDGKGYYFEPTVITGVKHESRVMVEEIFGPVLPILTFDDLHHVIVRLSEQPKPLALYLFSEDQANILDVTERCAFGGGCINDTIIHLATSEMGFGGVGESGMGAYHGKTGFDTFTHYKSIVNKKTWLDLPMRYQPYKKINEFLLHIFLR